MLALTIPGDPLSKQRPRWNTKTQHAYTPQETRLREEGIRALARCHYRELAVDPLGLFSLRAGFYLRGNQRRDVDNMLKLVSDALTGLVWADDSQVVEVVAFKVPADHAQASRSEVLVSRLPGQMAYTFGTCSLCRRPFRTYPSWKYRTYCSRRCAGLAIQQRARVSCATCGTTYEVPQCRVVANKRHFCSRECKSAFGSEQRMCVICGSAFRVAQSTRKKTCSRSCATTVRHRAAAAIRRAGQAG